MRLNALRLINGADHTVEVDGDTPPLCILRDVHGVTGVVENRRWRSAAARAASGVEAEILTPTEFPRSDLLARRGPLASCFSVSVCGRARPAIASSTMKSEVAERRQSNGRISSQ
jgi:hypothetical protein